MNVIIVLLLIVLNGVFAMAEIAVVSSNKFRLRQKAQAGNGAAERALVLAENPNRFLSTVQIGITLVGVFAGAFGGATLAGPLAEVLARIGWLAPYSEGLAFALVVAAITYLSLVVGELVPKRIGLSNPEGIASGIAGLMHGLSVVAGPLVWFLGASTDLLLRLLRVRPRAEVISEEEIDMVIEQGRKAGVVEPAEQEIIENAFWLGEKTVRAIMTPRHRVRWFDVDASPAQILYVVGDVPHGRYLVYEGDSDNVLGFVATADLLERCLRGESPDLRRLLRPPLIVPESLPILMMLERFRSSATHLALVLDEYGSFEGLVTLSDILEELVGDVLPEDSDEPPDVEEVSSGEWRISGGLHIDQFLELLSLERSVDLSDRGFETVGGLLSARLGRIPSTGDSLVFHGFGLTVEEMTGLRVRRVRVSRVSQQAGDSS